MNNTLILQPKTFTDKIRILRLSEQLTQRDLAGLAGVRQEDIDRIEHDIPLQLETKLKILRVLYAKSHLH